jgi:D-tyrosyl-tRNA(Tyr) deacylase
MRAVVQRCTSGTVTVGGKITGQVGKGYVVLASVGRGDTDEDAAYVAAKVTNLRVFEDENGKMNKSILDAGGSVLAISQFTLHGDTRGQRRPAFVDAAPPDEGLRLFNVFVEAVRKMGVVVETGVFGAHMMIHIDNDGPVTILIDSKKTF